MFLSRVAALLLVLSVALGQRIYLGVEGNPLDIFAVAFVAVTAILWISDSLAGGLPRPYGALGVVTLGPLFVLLVVLPVVGVVAGWYGVTVLYSWMIVGVPLGILSLGRAARLHGLRLDRILWVLILLHGVYGLGQTVVRLGVIPLEFWPTRAWDIASQAALSDAYVITGRSTGLFVNANTFGLWSCAAVLVGAFVLGGWQRNVAIALGVVGVIGSQSRTAIVGLAFLAMLYVLYAVRNSRAARRLFFVVLAGLPFAIVASQFGMFSGLIESSFVQRLGSAVGVVSEGVDADGNLAARFESWNAALEFSAQYPFGTFGPPQALFGSFIDSQYVSFFLQGGILLILAYIFALLSPVALARRGVPLAGALGAACAVVGLASFAMLPAESPAGVALFWLLGAVALSRPTGEMAGGGVSVPLQNGLRTYGAGNVPRRTPTATVDLFDGRDPSPRTAGDART